MNRAFVHTLLPCLSVALLLSFGPAPDEFGRTAMAAPPSIGEDVSIHDPGGKSLKTFHQALARTSAGGPAARMVFYGASHVASDTFTGRLRQALQKRFGDAGHGFVLPAKPWRYYRHADVNIDGTLTWFGDWVGKVNDRKDGYYGLAGVSISSEDPLDYASLATTIDNEMGRRVSSFELWYLEQPGGGSLDIRIDGHLVKRLSTSGLVPGPAYARFEVNDGGHKLLLTPIGDGEVRLFGVAMERSTPGVILDALGVNGARAAAQLNWNEAIYTEHLRRRKPDLVVLAYGTNESGDEGEPIERYEANLRRVLTRLTGAVPTASCLLIGPSDRPIKTRRGYQDRPRTADIIRAQKEIGAEFGCGMFDLVEFMGGAMAMVRWVRHSPPYASKDHVHFNHRGYDRLAEVLLAALLDGASL